MLRKTINYIIISFLVLFIIAYIIIDFLDSKRLEKILNESLGNQTTIYLTKIKNNTEGYFTSFIQETYIFKISDTNKVNCLKIGELEKTEFLFTKIDNTYINSKKDYCWSSRIDSSKRLINILIQDGILILKVFVD